MVTRLLASQGEVFFASLDPVVGSEQRGLRPVVVLSRNSHNANSRVVSIAPFTTSMTMSEHPGALFVGSADSGLERESLLLLFQIRTIDRLRLRQSVGMLAPDVLEKALHIIRQHFSTE
jgi:mRNA interferase MazF